MNLRKRLCNVLDNATKSLIAKRTSSVVDPFLGEIKEIKLSEKDIFRLQAYEERINKIAVANGINKYIRSKYMIKDSNTNFRKRKREVLNAF